MIRQRFLGSTPVGVADMIREINRYDIDEDYQILLRQLSGDEDDWRYRDLFLAHEEWWDHYRNNENFIVFVYEKDDEIIGTASVLIEHKLLLYGSKVGHIEDVVIDSEARGLGIGKQLIQSCVGWSMLHNCYKVILDCSKDNIPFYEACGFYAAEHCMRMDLKHE